MKLPDKRSELIRLAVHDAIKISHNPAYKLNMEQWHSKEYWDDELGQIISDNVCNVCLAGSVMACTLKAKVNSKKSPNSYSEDLMGKLNLINNWREGAAEYEFYFWLADEILNEKQKIAISEAQDVIKHHYNSRLERADWNTYFKAANILEKVGL